MLCGTGAGVDCAGCNQTERRVVVIPMASVSMDNERQDVTNYVATIISDTTTYTIQSGVTVCNAVNGSSCRYDYYVLSNDINAGVLAVIDDPGMNVLFPCYLCLEGRQSVDA